MASMKSPGRDIAALMKCIDDLKNEKNVKTRTTHYDSLTQFVVKSNLTDEAIDCLHSVAIPITLDDVSRGSESLILSALGFLGGLLQVIKLPLSKQVAVIKTLTTKLRNVEEKTQSRKLMWSLANVQFDEALPESSLSAMLEAACLFLREKPPVFSLSTVCESLNALRNLGTRNRAFAAANIELIFLAVVPWLFNEADRIRELSIACLEPFTSEVAKNKVLGPNFQGQLRSKYYGVLNQLVAAETAESLRIWSFLIQGFGTELHESVALLNELLKIEESALKSKNSTFRQCALERWKFIIDCFALNPAVLNNSKRIKLVLVPLKSTDTRTANFSKTKIELWWYLLNKLGPNAEQRFQEVTLPLLNFCFGSQTDKTQVRGTALVFSNIVPLACAVLAGILSPEKEFDCVLDENSRLNRIHSFASAEDFGKSIETFSQFSGICLNLMTGIDPPEIYEWIIRGFIERCILGNHLETLDTFIHSVTTIAVEKPVNMEIIFNALASKLESAKVVEFLLKHAGLIVNWYAENEPMPNHPCVRFLNKLLAASVSWDLRKSSASFMELIEDVARVHEPVTTSIHPVVELWNKFAVVVTANLENVKLNEADLRVLVLPQSWTALSLEEKMLAPWFTLFSNWAKIDCSIIKLAINFNHLEEEANVEARSVKSVIRALKSELNQHFVPLSLWSKQWVSSWVKQAKNKEHRTACTDSLVELLLAVSEESEKLEDTEHLLKEVRDALQEQSNVKEISEILAGIFTASTKSESVSRLRNQQVAKLFSWVSTKTPGRSKQKPKHLDDFVVVPPVEKTKRVLTEHQKEVIRSKRRSSNVPAMYNDLSQSSLQSDSLLETQSNDGVSNIPVVSSCSIIEREEEALMEPPCPVGSTVSAEKSAKNDAGHSLSIEEIVKNDMKLRSKVSVSVPKFDPKPSTRRSARLSSTESTNSVSSDSDNSSPVINAFKKPGPASRKAQMAANQEKAKQIVEENTELKEISEEGQTDKENECTPSQTKSAPLFGSPARRVTLQPVLETRNESETVETSNKNSEEEKDETANKEEPEKTVLNEIDMEVEAEETVIEETPEENNVNSSSLETANTEKTENETPEETANSIPMEITLCAEQKETVAVNETRDKAPVFPLKSHLLKTYALKKKVPLKGPAPCSSKRGAQMLELSRKITRNEPPSKKLRKTDDSPAADEAAEVVVTPEGSPARTAKWIPRTYSPYASPSTGILKKRQQLNEEADDGCDSPVSSASKARRVSFADPEVSHSVKISPAKKRLTRTRTRRSLISTYANNEADSETSSKQELSTVVEASCNMSLSETCMVESQQSAVESSETVVADTSMEVTCVEELIVESEKSESCDREEDRRDSEPEIRTAMHSVETLYPSLMDCEESIECLYDLLGEADRLKFEEFVLEKNIETLGDLCKMPVTSFSDQPGVELIMKAIEEYLAKRSSPKKAVEHTIEMDEDIETSIPIVPSDDSKSSEEVKTPDSCPNGQIIRSDSLPVENEQVEATPIETDDNGDIGLLPSSEPSSSSVSQSVGQETGETILQENVKDIMALDSDEVISMIEQHPKKDEIILALLRRHISFSFMLNGKAFPVQE